MGVSKMSDQPQIKINLPNKSLGQAKYFIKAELLWANMRPTKYLIKAKILWANLRQKLNKFWAKLIWDKLNTESKLSFSEPTLAELSLFYIGFERKIDILKNIWIVTKG